MTKTRFYPKGTIVLFSEGEYSNFGYCGEVVTLQDLDLDAAIAEFKDGKEYERGPSDFIAHLVATQVVAPLDCSTVHLGSYGELR